MSYQPQTCTSGGMGGGGRGPPVTTCTAFPPSPPPSSSSYEHDRYCGYSYSHNFGEDAYKDGGDNNDSEDND